MCVCIRIHGRAHNVTAEGARVILRTSRRFIISVTNAPHTQATLAPPYRCTVYTIYYKIIISYTANVLLCLLLLL